LYARGVVRRKEGSMGLMELVFTVCATAQMSLCQDQRLQFDAAGSLRECAMGAPPYIAQWIGEHPKWTAVRWHCEYTAERKTPI
jgi:hypothetical protein